LLRPGEGDLELLCKAIPMSRGELLTRGTIWITILAYATGSVIFALAAKTAWGDATARIAWTVACAILFVHLIAAFHYYHGWSHHAAYLDTARQTEKVVGLNWGGGLFINYALLFAWTLDLAGWWRKGLRSYRRRPWPLIAVWHGFLIFIIFNATVVFKGGVVRWAGLAVCLVLVLSWLMIARRNSTITQVDLESD
jgi:hypothetical protein